MPDISTHAAHRLQKRSIPPRVIDWLHLYGSKQYDGHGAVIRFFDRAARARLSGAYDDHLIETNKKYLSVYMVEDTAGDLVITIGYRHRRIRRR